MMTQWNIGIVVAAVLAIAIAGIATELPGYDDLPTAIGKTVSVVEVWVKEANTSSTVDGPNTLEVLAQVKDNVAGEKIEGDVKGKYEEFHAPRPTMPGHSVDYVNYTGSGSELRTRSNDRVLLLISGKADDTDMFTVVRVEPVDRKKEVQDLFAKKNAKPQP